MIQNLKYYWRLNLLVVLGIAIATAVLTGALLMGDAMRGSLRQMTLERLGEIDQVLVADHFFSADLAERLLPRDNDAVQFENNADDRPSGQCHKSGQ